jgi:hypothetical protein
MRKEKRRVALKNRKFSLGKKGFTYLITSIFLGAIIFAVIVANDSHFFRDKQNIDSQRLIYVNDFVKGFNQDYERAISIASFRTMVALEDYVASTGTFLNDTESSFRETVYNGSIGGIPSSIMNNSAIKDYIAKVEEISSRLGMEINVTVNEIQLSQSSPWQLDVRATTEIKIVDSSDMAIWHYNKTFLSKVPIDNLRDPIYSVYTYNRLSNTIRKSNFTYLISPLNETDNLKLHIENGYYISSNKSPNFIMRFENNITPDLNGIESIVNINTISDQDIVVYPSRIKVDYIYFNDITAPKICNIQDIPQTYEFVLTSDRVDLYQVGNLTYSLSC